MIVRRWRCSRCSSHLLSKLVSFLPLWLVSATSLRRPVSFFLGPPVAITQRASPYILLLFLSFFLFFLQREISAVSRPIAAKPCRMIGNGYNFKNRSKIWGSSPQKKLGPKNMLFSPERNKTSTIGKRRCKLRSLPRLLTYSGELWSTNGEK